MERIGVQTLKAEAITNILFRFGMHTNKRTFKLFEIETKEEIYNDLQTASCLWSLLCGHSKKIEYYESSRYTR